MKDRVTKRLMNEVAMPLDHIIVLQEALLVRLVKPAKKACSIIRSSAIADMIKYKNACVK